MFLTRKVYFDSYNFCRKKFSIETKEILFDKKFLRLEENFVDSKKFSFI